MRRTEIKKRPLADTVLASLEAEPKEYREQDGNGLYFRVKPNGQKSWLFRFKKPDGAWSWHGLGGYPEIPAKVAREKARTMRDLVSAGGDPVEHKAGLRKARDASVLNPFRDAAEDWFKHKADGGLAESTLYLMRGYLDNDVLPAFGDKPIAEVTRKDCADLQARIEARNAPNTRDKVRVALRQIFSQAIARGLCDNNPASELLSISTKTPKATPYPHLLEAELPAFLRALRTSTSRAPARTATWLCLWTASRPGMVRWAEWSEIDFDAALWTVPADKMKMRRDHYVPLPRQAIEALRELQRSTGRSRYLFPGIGATHPVISENTINLTLCKIGYRGRLVGHGTRHTASTLLREHGWQKDHIEAQLAHKETGVSGIYNQASYLPQRRALVQWYADYLDCLADGVTPEQRAEFSRKVNVVQGHASGERK
ncbi:tyrosine-type recombinase/integrase [Pseudomonas lundensis]|uniref:tyrosine-type recombinase/integrase n=1 Tax=Pseudomonas lundensis TaxID=86185 RepID=UPI000654A71F|nr:tyrosine-type recombinase/integrase [Pseudomonas lundensis]KMM90180.1 integrase [Pseudomonas lundensis]NNA19628.1 tyrosine-type recombinase/integrase [Pseudomonas lundensis]